MCTDRTTGTLAECSPALAAEWHPTLNGDLSPNRISAGSHQRVWWQRVCDPREPLHEWQAQVKQRMVGATGCGVCHRRRVNPGVNDLATSFPAKAAQWHPTLNGDLKPHQVAASSGRKVWWLDERTGRVWQSSPRGRTAKARAKAPGFTQGAVNLADGFPEIAAEWHPSKNGALTPHGVAARSGKLVWWQRECLPGEPVHEWQARVSQRVVRGTGCPICSGKLIVPGINDLATTHPELVPEWHPTRNGDLTPEQVSGGSVRKVWWQRQCVTDGPPHEWETGLLTRTYAKSGCPACMPRSAGEVAVATALDAAGLKYEREWRIPDLPRRLRFDFRIAELRTLIEFDGPHHRRPVKFHSRDTDEAAARRFARQQVNDAAKDTWARENGWRLIRLAEVAAVSEELARAGVMPHCDAVGPASRSRADREGTYLESS